MDSGSKLVNFIKRHKKATLNILRVLITAAGITLVAFQVNPVKLWQVLSGTNWLVIGAALLFFQTGIFIRAFRWRALLSALGEPPSLLRLVGLYYAGSFFNTFLPTGFGGEVVRAVEIGQDTNADVAIATVGIDRLSGLIALFVIALLALPFQIATLPRQLVALVIAVCVAGIAGWLLLIYTNILENILAWVASKIKVINLTRLVQIARTIRAIDRPAVHRAIAASFVFNVVQIGTHYVISLAFDLGLPLLFFAVFTPISSMLLLLPSIQGLGVREPTFVLLLGAVGIAPERALAFSVGVYLEGLSTGLVGAMYYAIYSLVTMIRKRTQTDGDSSIQTPAEAPLER